MTDAAQERIFAVAIKRDGKIWDGGQSAHWKLRANLGDENPQNKAPGDVEGFIVSPGGRFVGRYEAHEIAFKAGQTSQYGKLGDRELLSSEVTW